MFVFIHITTQSQPPSMEVVQSETHYHRWSPCPLHSSPGSWRIHTLRLLLSVRVAGDRPQPLVGAAGGSCTGEPVTSQVRTVTTAGTLQFTRLVNSSLGSLTSKRVLNERPCFFKNYHQGLGDDSVVKSTWCSSRRPGFNSQHPSLSVNSISGGNWHVWSLWAPAHIMCPHPHSDTQTYVVKE